MASKLKGNERRRNWTWNETRNTCEFCPCNRQERQEAGGDASRKTSAPTATETVDESGTNIQVEETTRKWWIFFSDSTVQFFSQRNKKKSPGRNTMERDGTDCNRIRTTWTEVSLFFSFKCLSEGRKTRTSGTTKIKKRDTGCNKKSWYFFLLSLLTSLKEMNQNWRKEEAREESRWKWRCKKQEAERNNDTLRVTKWSTNRRQKTNIQEQFWCLVLHLPLQLKSCCFSKKTREKAGNCSLKKMKMKLGSKLEFVLGRKKECFLQVHFRVSWFLTSEVRQSPFFFSSSLLLPLMLLFLPFFSLHLSSLTSSLSFFSEGNTLINELFFGESNTREGRERREKSKRLIQSSSSSPDFLSVSSQGMNPEVEGERKREKEV